jgi:hypothetical protein
MFGKCKVTQEQGIGSFYAILITLALSSIPLSLLFSTNEISQKIDQQVYRLNSEVLLHHFLDKITADTQQVGVRVMPRIHTQGLVTLSSGEPILLSKTPNLFPDRISDAISWIETDFSLALTVKQFTNTGGITCCFMHSSLRSIPRELTTYLVITRDGIFEAQERFPHSAARQSCPTLNLSSSESVIADTSYQYYHQGAALIIPIKRINTIYRDTLGILRLVGHEGKSITSNQPLRADIPVLRFNLLSEFSQIVALTLELEDIGRSADRRSALRVFQLLPAPALTLIGNMYNAT